jgi:hypothetical protein
MPVDDLICEARGITHGELAEMRARRSFGRGVPAVMARAVPAPRVPSEDDETERVLRETLATLERWNAFDEEQGL